MVARTRWNNRQDFVKFIAVGADGCCMSRIGRAAVAATLSTITLGCLALPATAGAPVTAAAAPGTASPVDPTAPVYVVKKGDYLKGIADRMGVKLGALLKANKIKIDSVIVPGDKLAVPAGGTLPADVAAPQTPASPTPP